MTKSAFKHAKAEESPGFLLWQTTTLWQKQIKQALAPFAISHAQFVILAVMLWFTEQQTVPNQTMLVAKTQLDKMTVSKALRVLVQKDLIKRQESHQDTRAKSVELSAKGLALVPRLVATVEAIDAKFFAAVDGKQKAELLDIFNRLVSNRCD